jgi:AraC-like DNA-binding protein
MTRIATTPAKIVQNRHGFWERASPARLVLYRRILRHTVRAMERGRQVVRIPRLRGMRLRLAGMPFHATPELFFQQAGQTLFRVPGERFCLRAGEICLMPGGVPHGETTQGNAFLTVIGMFPADGVSLHLGRSTIRKGVDSGPIDHFSTLARARLLRLLEESAAAVDEGAEARDSYVRGLMLAAFALLEDLVRLTPRPLTPQHPLVARCQDLIQVEYANPALNAAWLAGRLGCTVDHLSRVFARKSGRRLIWAIHNQRMAVARHLLEKSDLNMGETAWACGFATVSYFNRIFRRWTGVTPRAYRAQVPRSGGLV